MMVNNGSEAFIDLNALCHNLQQVRTLVPKSKVIAMIKSNGYGHGLLPVAKNLEDADAFGVACLGEASILRKNGIDKKILLMRGFSDIAELFTAIDYNLDLVIHDMTQLAILEQVSLSKPITAWMKIDTGMHRLGFSIEEAEYVYDKLQKNSNVKKPLFIMTHLAAADDFSNPLTQKQLDTFQKVTANFIGQKSIANSAAIINWPNSYGDWVRPGVILFGVSPLANKTGADHGLKPVMTLRSKLIAVKNIAKGERVGYGSEWTAPENMPVAIVAVGYGDGYPRHAKNGTPVLIYDTICPLIGRVSMDMIAVDLRNKSTVKCGDYVVLWGEGLPIEHVAKWADTIAYDLLCSVTRRVEFKYSR
jgi:alanine racemase